MSFDILAASKTITEKYIRYLKTMFDIENPEYRALFEQKMQDTSSFSKGPYLDVVDSFESGESVKKLIQDKVLNADFDKIDSIYSKTLYKHQETAIHKMNTGRNIVVSTGTGSGKTESFLIPVLNSLMNEKVDKGTLTPGVRALLVYPMNALANDQISRLRDLLKNYPYITFGSYTGQTEEYYEKALAKYKALNHGEKPLKNELISREQMKDTPPHILITNYSMLEYLMLRPRDNSLFQGQYSGNWRFVVLDEAHTYSGSTGIEVSMLLRRLKAYLNNANIQYVLTSATLGGEKTNEDVATFASRLCNSVFCAEDVIRASRIKLYQPEGKEIELSNQDYYELNEILDSGFSDEKKLDLLSSYLNIKDDTEDCYEYLFDVLLRDHTFWRMKRFLSTPKTVKEIGKAFDWDDKTISTFVNVASKATKNRKKLFDARYHMFIRATDGVFITLGKHKDLSLSRQTTKLVNNVEYKYFEALTCTQCHALYLLGVIEDDNGLPCLKQKANLDSNNIREAFLIGDTVNNDDEDSQLVDENLQITHYELCPHCGFIREKNQVHKTKCKHSEEEYINITKVKQSERTGRVTKCIKCEGTNNSGILRSFFAGQEASTSVVGTALFQELPSSEIKTVSLPVEKDDSGFDFDDGFESIDEKQYTPKAKQFIAFSDNRQAAAFFATYFYETYQGFLYSRITNENVIKLDETGKPLVNFVKDMASDFKNHQVSEMFDDHPDYLKESWKAVMKELIESYSRNSLIGLGLMKIGFADEVRMLPNTKYNLSSSEVGDMCLVLLRSMLEDNAIISPYTFVEADTAFFSNNGAEKVYQLSSPQKYVRSFVPKNDKTTNKRYEYIQRVFNAKGINIEREELMLFMQNVWTKLLEKQEVVLDRQDHAGKQVNLSKLKVCNSNSWFRCTKCHRITAYNISNVCPAYKCEGTLESVNVRELEKDNHYYRIYNGLDIQPLRIVEHTAQLNSEEAYRLQEQFKEQKIDVLSCSTTFEMGVDIGDLETVFMRNMPPTPSNYVQRAGRAGRSSKSAALALTFCNKSNHDFSYFINPIQMINGEILPPLFKVENEKIGIRHLYSAALAFFWRRNIEYFGNVKDFFGDSEPCDGYEDFKSYIESSPSDLKKYLLSAFPDELIQRFGIETFEWSKWLFDKPDPSYPNLKSVYEQYREEVNSLYEEKAKIEADNKINNSIVYRINTYTRENIITFLSRNNILPKYGFPVDTVELEVSTDKNSRKPPIELSRDLAVAISEYAPGCEVVAAGNLIKSRYIKRDINKSWRQFDYVLCEKCKTLNIAVHHDVKEEQSILCCEQCGEKFSKTSIKTFIIPEFGFASETKLEKPSLIKPERTFRTEASMVSEGLETLKGKYSIGGLTVNVVTMEDGEIAVLNKSDFYVCPSCGYSLAQHEAKNAYTPFISSEHKKSNGFKCRNKSLQKYSLGYRFKTDALCLNINGYYKYEEAYSILQAIILSACKLLNLDNSEISGCLQYCENNEGSSYNFIIYDTTPGGAGHVKRFKDKATLTNVLAGAYYKAKDCDCGGETGDTSCYKCLRTYQNQQHHDLIKRKYVIDNLSMVLDADNANGDDTLAPVKKQVQKKSKELKLANGDAGINSESYEYVVSSLEIEDELLRDRIVDAMRSALVPKPDLEWVDFSCGDAEDSYAELVWTKKKVLAFAPSNRENYLIASESDYKCFIFDASIDINKFVEALA